MSKTVLEELATVIEKKNERIQELEEKLEKMEYKDAWAWRHLREMTEEENLNLPLPRLELRYRSHSKYTHIVDYGLVQRHLCGEIMFIPISSTKIDGKVVKLSTPYRDGAHMYHDMDAFDMRGFVVDGTDVRELSFQDPDVPISVLERRKLHLFI